MPATLTALRANAIRVTHEDVPYEPIASDATPGALLFALDLLGHDAVDEGAMRYADRVTLAPALAAAREHGWIKASRRSRRVPPRRRTKSRRQAQATSRRPDRGRATGYFFR